MPASRMGNSQLFPSADKAALRRHYRCVRRQHIDSLQGSLEGPLAALVERLLPERLLPDLPIGVFWPLAGEPDLAGALRALGCALALPAVTAGRLEYRPWPVGLQLQPDDCGIAAPPAAAAPLAPRQLALLLVPALAIYRQVVRLGYGGGWYDRLRADPAWRAVPALAVLPAACVLHHLPRDPWDVPLDGWIDEQGLHAVDALRGVQF
jgi:5-formyltetrahydrofolate cyclo-ligase